MIDYENVLKEFVGEVIVYLTRSLKKVKDKVVYARIIQNIEKLKVIRSNPLYYADYDVRCKKNLIVEPDAFVVKDKTFYEYQRVMWAAQDLNDEFDYKREEAQKILMNGYKAIKSKNAKNSFEKLKFNLFSPERIFINSNQR